MNSTQDVVAAITRPVVAGEWAGLAEWMADDGVFHGTKGGIDEGLVARGPQAVVDYFTDAAAMWERWDFEFEGAHYGDNGTVVLFWRETSVSRHSPAEMVNETATLFRIRDGKVVEGQGFMSRADALAAGGI